MRGAWTAACIVLLGACVPVPPSEHIGATPPPDTTVLPTNPLTFDLDSLDERSVSAPAFRGKPAVIAFVVSDTLAGQAEADILATLAQRQQNRKILSEGLGVSPERLDEVMDKYRPGGRSDNGPPPRTDNRP